MSFEEYVKLVGIDSIAEYIAMTLEDMATNGEDYLEASTYLDAMLQYVQNTPESNKNLFCDAVNNVLEKTLPYIKGEFEGYDGWIY